jgi:hypothetical protein
MAKTLGTHHAKKKKMVISIKTHSIKPGKSEALSV